MKKKTLKAIFVLSFILVSNNIENLAQSKLFYGAYQNCPFSCETIQINRDFTFVHQLNGDLYNDKRTQGTWQFIGKNKIKVVSDVAKTSLQVLETETKRTSNFLIVLIDSVGEVISYGRVFGVANGEVFECETNFNGVAEIPECEQFSVGFGSEHSYHGTHIIRNKQANLFTVIFTNQQMVDLYIDDIWQIKNGYLYFIKPDGSLNKNYYLKKLSGKKEQKIFEKK